MRKSLFLAEVCLLALLALLVAFALVETRNIDGDGRLFPLFVTITGLPIILAALAQTLWRARRGVSTAIEGAATSIEGAATSIEGAETSIEGAETSTVRDGQVTVPGEEQVDLFDAHQIEVSWSQMLRFWVWFLAFCGGLWLFGFYVGVPVVAGAFVFLDARKSLLKAVATGFTVWLCLYPLFTQALGIHWPPGVFF